MYNNNLKIPQLRFPDFSGEWGMKKLGEISEKITEKNIDNQYKETFTNSAEYGIISQRSFFDKDIANEEKLNNYYIVRQNYFVYNPRISNFAPVGPIKRNKLGRVGVMSPLYYVFKTVNVDVAFLEYYFETSYWHKFMKLNGDSGARADRFAIKNATFKTMPLPYPKQNEQQKIGDFLSKIDYEIDLAQKLLDLMTQQKKAYMQKMFSQELRFKDDNGNDYPEWQKLILGVLGDTYSGLSGKTKVDFGHGTSNFITYMNVFKNVIANNRLIEKVNIKNCENQNNVNYKDILITMSSEIPEETGMSSIWLFDKNNIYLNSFCFGFRVTNREVDPLYLVRFLRSEKMRRRIIILSQGSTRFNISKKEILKLNIDLPNIKEQQKIGLFFYKFDDLIDKQTCKLDLLKQRKRALLQQMFI